MKIIVMLVGEVSGDILAAALIRRVKACTTDVRFIGVGGEKMIAEGFESFMDMDHLSVIGVEAIRQLPKLLFLRARLMKKIIRSKPDLLIGIDAPDFNFAIERKIRETGVTVWHWVSPSIWAWRRRRIKKITRSCDEIMCLFPQEVALYQGHAIKASFYGHPMADEIPLESTVLHTTSRQQLQADYPELGDWQGKKCMALLPGSRFGEVKYMLPLYLQVATQLLEKNDQWRFVVPIAKQSLVPFFQHCYQSLDERSKQRIVLVEGRARECMSVADIVLLASGTATLEAMLLKKPMIVAHQGPWLNYLIFKYTFYTPYVSLPNFMEGDFLIPELLFADATVDRIIDTIEQMMEKPQRTAVQIERFTFHHQQLEKSATDKISDKIVRHITA